MVGDGLRRRAGAVVAAVLAATVLAGCAEAIGGTAVSTRSGATRAKPTRPSPTTSRPKESTAEDLLGDPTTIDACSLTDPEAFSALGRPEPKQPSSLDECLVKIKTAVPEPIDVYVGNLDRTESYPDLNGKKATDLPGGLKVVDYETDSDVYCTQLLVFPDGITLSVNGSVYGTEEPKLCDIVRAGMEKVVDVLRDGDVRHLDFDGNSLGTIDPCELTPAEAVAAVPGLGATKPKTYPARHHCAWTAADNTARVRVMFTVGAPPEPSGDGASETPIADRRTVLTPTPKAGSYAFCGAHTGHIPFARDGLVEIATIFVRMREGQVDAACKAATDIAGALWPKLPEP